MTPRFREMASRASSQPQQTREPYPVQTPQTSSQLLLPATTVRIPCCVMESSPATQGNTAFDVSSSQDIIVTPGETPAIISTGIFEPLPQGTFGLLLGKLGVTSGEVQIHTRVIDSDYKRELKVMVSTTFPWKVSKGNRSAQLLILPYVGIGYSNIKQGSRGFGSTGQARIFLTEKILESRPTCQVKIFKV